jgi:hypothetical protein
MQSKFDELWTCNDLMGRRITKLRYRCTNLFKKWKKCSSLEDMKILASSYPSVGVAPISLFDLFIFICIHYTECFTQHTFHEFCIIHKQMLPMYVHF